jgi:hypothetical protein
MELASEPRSGLDASAQARSHMRTVRVQILAARQGGVFFGPFVPDTRGSGRFPPAVRLRATLFGVPLGELTLANEHTTGRVVDLSIGSSWLAHRIALSLILEAAALAPQAGWESLCWELPSEAASVGALARALGFRPMSAAPDELRFERPLRGSAW